MLTPQPQQPVTLRGFGSIVHSGLQLLLWETHKCELLDITLPRQLEGTFQMKAQLTALGYDLCC